MGVDELRNIVVKLLKKILYLKEVYILFHKNILKMTTKRDALFDIAVYKIINM